MDNYAEHILEKKIGASQMLAMIGAIMLTVSGVIVLLMIKFGIGVIIIAVGAFLIYVAKENMSLEYEYEFTNGDCDIAKIINKASRKDKYKFSVGEVMRVLPYNSEKFKNELDVNAKLRVLDFTSGYEENNDNWYAFITSVGNEDKAIILELNEKCLEHVKVVYRQKFEK